MTEQSSLQHELEEVRATRTILEGEKTEKLEFSIGFDEKSVAARTPEVEHVVSLVECLRRDIVMDIRLLRTEMGRSRNDISSLAEMVVGKKVRRRLRRASWRWIHGELAWDACPDLAQAVMALPPILSRNRSHVDLLKRITALIDERERSVDTQVLARVLCRLLCGHFRRCSRQLREPV